MDVREKIEVYGIHQNFMIWLGAIFLCKIEKNYTKFS